MRPANEILKLASPFFPQAELDWEVLFRDNLRAKAPTQARCKVERLMRRVRQCNASPECGALCLGSSLVF